MAFSSGEVAKECIVLEVTILAKSILERCRNILVNAAKSVPIGSETER